jgi:hypothetical protein
MSAEEMALLAGGQEMVDGLLTQDVVDGLLTEDVEGDTLAVGVTVLAHC